MISRMAAFARITAFTHRGRVREGNEDTIAVGGWVSEPEMAAPRVFRHDLAAPLVCAVADGMGGHRAGEVASRHVALRLAEESERLADARAVQRTLAAIDAELYEAMATDATLEGMGTTVVGLALGPRLVAFNVGDSRLYRFRARRLSQLSIDDTPPGPRSGLLTQTLGGGFWPHQIAPHIEEEDVAVPARFLLCSDGLTDMLDDRDIANCMARSDEEAVTQLFELAMSAGGMDNISIVLVKVAASRVRRRRARRT